MKLIANSIAECFPREDSRIYYIPSSPGVVASGKLHRTFFNRRVDLKKCGLIDSTVTETQADIATLGEADYQQYQLAVASENEVEITNYVKSSFVQRNQIATKDPNYYVNTFEILLSPQNVSQFEDNM
jgi:hypothetical protein